MPVNFTSQLWQQEGQPWTATAFALNDLRAWSLEPESDSSRQTVRLVGEHARWDAGGQPFWEGEVGGCVDGSTLADRAYFGVDVSAHRPVATLTVPAPSDCRLAMRRAANADRATRRSMPLKGRWSSSEPLGARRTPSSPTFDGSTLMIDLTGRRSSRE